MVSTTIKSFIQRNMVTQVDEMLDLKNIYKNKRC